MNLFVGVGKIDNVRENGTILRFDLNIRQKKPCVVPCASFNPTRKFTDFINRLQNTGKPVFVVVDFCDCHRAWGGHRQDQFLHNGRCSRHC